MRRFAPMFGILVEYKGEHRRGKIASTIFKTEQLGRIESKIAFGDLLVFFNLCHHWDIDRRKRMRFTGKCTKDRFHPAGVENLILTAIEVFNLESTVMGT